MNKKELLSKIRKTAELEMPDVFDRINIEAIEINDSYEEVSSPLNLRRSLAYTFASLFIVFTVMLAYNFVYIPSVNDYEPLETETEIVGFQTVSAASLLSSIEVTELNFVQDSYIVTELANPSIEITDEIDLINSYMNMAETIITDEDYMLYQEIESDREEYAYAFMYNGVDLTGKLISYNGYYNIIEDEDTDIQSGILVHNDNTYNFRSSLSEGENGTFYKYTISLSQNNYVEVINISGDNVQKFSYSVYKGGSLSEESVLTLTSFRNQLSANIEITTNSQSTLSLDFSRSYNDDSQEFSVQYMYQKMSQELTGEFTVSVIEDSTSGNLQYQYSFTENQNIVTNRQNKGNQDASDDDFTTTNSNNSTNDNTNNGNSDTNTSQGNSDTNTGQGNTSGRQSSSADSEISSNLI